MQSVHQKRNWTLTPAAFQRLLQWFGGETESRGETYLYIRQQLVTYFDRKNCTAPDELADETLNRVARRLEEENGLISESPAHYCYIVARYVFIEYWRGPRRNEVPLDRILRQPAEEFSPLTDEAVTREKLMSCLDQCTEKLDPLNRDLIIRYYHGERRLKIENRRALAEKLGITLNALSIRTCRIREKLEACVERCTGS